MKPWRDRLDEYRRTSRTIWEQGGLPAPVRAPIVLAILAADKVRRWIKGPAIKIKKKGKL